MWVVPANIMRIEEARWIEACTAAHIEKCRADPAGVVLNLGSGTRKSREVSKPYIDRLTLQPLRDKGYRVVHSDLFEGDGIDLCGDLFDPLFQRQLESLQSRVVIFCNVLEHLPVGLRNQVPQILQRLLAPGGHLFITVPRSYPYHADPIDTMYRPTPDEVAAMFAALQVVDARVIDSDSYLTEFRRGGAWRRSRKILRLLFPFVRPRRWLSHLHRLFWLHRPYRHSCVLFKKPA
jgi:SAM-dependent methyltransferase